MKIHKRMEEDHYLSFVTRPLAARLYPKCPGKQPQPRQQLSAKSQQLSLYLFFNT